MLKRIFYGLYLYTEKRVYIVIALLAIANISYSQIAIQTALSPQQLVENILVGQGISVSNVTYSGSALSIGSFTNGNNTFTGMDEGIILCTGNVLDAVGPNSAPNTQTNTLGPSNAQLEALIPGYSIYDAAILEFDFIPMSDTIRFQYAFASEEYPEWVGSAYNDVFGFFVSGINPAGGNYVDENLAIIPGTANTYITVNTVNNGPLDNGPCQNCSYYVSNNGGVTIEYDGLTTVITTWLVVQPCTNYHIELAIGDGGDHSYDSGVFLKKNSFSSPLLEIETDYTTSTNAIEGCSNGIVKFTLENPSLSDRWINYTIGGTATNGTDYQTIPDSILMPMGADSVGFYIIPIADGIIEGQETVELIITTSSCSTDTMIVPINDYTPMLVNIVGNSVICEGDSTTLTASISDGVGPYSKLWSNNDTTVQIKVSPANNTNYTFDVTDACNNTVQDNIDIIVNPLPTVSIAASTTTVCAGSSSIITANGAINYQWTTPNSTSNPLTVNPTNNTNYQVVGTDANGCLDTADITINALPLPPISVAAVSSQICNGDNTIINAAGAASYSWSPGATLNTTTGASVIATPNTTITYTVVGTSANGCTDSATSAVTVNPIPTILINPANSDLCRGNSLALTASGGNTYNWSPALGLSSTNTANTTASPLLTTTYIVQGTTAAACSSSDTVVLTVHIPPTVSANPATSTICSGTATPLNAVGANTYAWSPATGLSATTGNNVSASPNSDQTYTIIGTDNQGCKDTTTLDVIVNTVSISLQDTFEICIGGNTNITATATPATSTLLWSTGSTNNTINTNPVATTTYYVTATGPTGCAIIDSATVIVHSLPTIIINPGVSSICEGKNISVTASGAATYNWLPLTNNSVPNGATTSLSPVNTTVYTVSGTDANGCTNSANTTITVNPLPNVSVTSDFDSLCIGASAILTANNALTYSWAPSASLSAATGNPVTATPTTPTSYIVTGRDINGCTNTDTVTVAVSPVINATAVNPNICQEDSSLVSVTSNISSTYLWSNGVTTSSFYADPTITTMYYVTVTGYNGCTNEDSVEVLILPQPPVNITPNNASLCMGQSQTLTASGALTYAWQANANLSSLTGAVVTASPMANDSYMVIGTDADGCVDTAYANITILDTNTIWINPISSIICDYDSIQLTAKVTGTPTISWEPSSIITPNTGDTIFAYPVNAGNYTIIATATSANGCQDTAIAHITVNPKPNLAINPDSSNICLGKSQTLIANGADTYQWSPALGLSATNISTVIADPNVTTTYTLIGTSLGCTDTATAYVGVHAYPIVTASAVPVQICPTDSSTITAIGADSYLWSPANGLSATTGNIVKASPDSTQLYTIIGSNVWGCTDTTTINTVVSPIPVISGTDSICDGQTATLIVVSNLPATTYLWSTGATTDNISASPTVTTTYTVTATDNNSGCTKDTSFVLTVMGIPNLAISPADTSICHGESLALTATGANSYLWHPNNTLSDSTTAITTATPTDSTIYSVIGTTIYGCKDTVQVAVNLFPIINVSVVPNSSYSCGGGSQVLTASGANTYSWSPITGLSSAVGAVVTAGPTQNAIYTVTGTDTNNCSDTAISHVSIYGPPDVTPAQPAICPGDSLKLTANTQNTPNTYLWSTGETSKDIWVTPDSTTIYSVTVNYPGGCTKSGIDTIFLFNDTVVNAFTTTPFTCLADTAILQATGSATYSWTGVNLINNTGDSVRSVPTGTNQYVVKGISSEHACKSYDTLTIQLFPLANISISASTNPLCKRDTAALTGIGGVSYQWSPNNRIDTLVGTTVNVFPLSQFRYYVKGTDSNGCRDTSSILLDVLPIPTIVIAPDSPVVCQGDTMELFATGSVGGYNWWPNFQCSGVNNDTLAIFPLANITYHTRGYSANGCHHDTFIYVNVRRTPLLGITPIVDSICLGDSIAITAWGAATYKWTPNNTLNDSIGSSVKASPSSLTTYTVVGTSTDGCTLTRSSTIKVNPNPIVSLLPANSLICENDSVQLTSSGGINYQWTPNFNIIINASSDTCIAFPHTDTTYKVVGFNSYGCKDSAFAVIQTKALPNVVAIPANPAICFGDSIELTASGANTYIWQPIYALDTNIGDRVWATPLVDTSYVVKGTDSQNCYNFDTVDIIVHPEINPTINPNDSICYGDSISLIATGGTTYLWTPSNSLSVDNNDTVIASPLASENYTAKVYDAFGCMDSIDVHITVLSLPNVQINPSPTWICIGDTTLLVASGATAYTWNPNLAISSITGDSVIVNPIIPTPYIVQGVDSLGCINYDTSLVSIWQLPNVVALPANPAICFGDSVELIVSGANTYLWSPSYNINPINTDSVWTSPLTDTSYIVKGTDANNCINYDTVEVIVRPEITPTINPNDSICYGDSISLIATGGTTYLWTPSNSLSVDNNDTVIASPLASENYTAKVYDAFGCMDSIDVYITVLSLPNVQINPSPTWICIGDTTLLVASGATSYTWNPNSAISSITGDSVNANPIIPTPYIVQGVDSLGCINYDTSLVSIWQLPNVILSANDTSICSGSSTQMHANGANTYLWWPNISLSDTVGSNIITTTLDTIIYYIEGTDTNNCKNTDTLEIIVKPKPALSISASDSLFCANFAITLTGHSDFNPTIMTWGDGTVASTTTDNPNNDTTYIIVGENIHGCTDTATLFVQANPFPLLNLSTTDTVICYSDTAHIISASQLSNISYLWSTGHTTPNIDVSPLVNSTYILIASDSIGCSDTISAFVRVQPIVALNILSDNMHVCAGDTINLTAITSFAVDSFNWSVGVGQNNIAQTPETDTTYYLIVIDSIGCTNNDSIFIMANNLPNLSLSTSPQDICIGDTSALSVSATTGPLNYVWSTGTTSQSLNVVPIITTTYTVTATDSIGCTATNGTTVTVNNLPTISINPDPANICDGDSIILGLNSNITLSQFVWSDNSTQSTINVSPLVSSNYSVTATDINGCVNSTQQLVNVYSNPTISINPYTDTICTYDSTQFILSYNHSLQSILWSDGATVYNPYFSPLNSQQYTVIYTDTNGCMAYDTSSVHVITRPTCTLVFDSIICSFDSSKVEYLGSASLGAITNWDFGSANVLSGTGIQTHYLQWNLSGTYYVTLDVTENGCTSFPDTAEILVHKSPEPSIYTMDTNTCDSLPVHFEGLPNGMTTYNWHFGDPLAMGNDTSSLQNPNYTYLTPGSYSILLEVVSPEGCPGNIIQNSMLSIWPNPVADFFADPPISYENDPVIEFVDRSSGAAYWQWDFGDPASGSYNASNDQYPYHIYQQKGFYIVKQIVQNVYGCTDTTSQTVDIDNGPTFYVPTAFSPNGDGLNDFFIPLGTDFKEDSYQIVIFARWGAIVYESKSYANHWDGTHYKSGEELNPAVFSYIIRYVDKFDVQKMRSGIITLLR